MTVSAGTPKLLLEQQNLSISIKTHMKKLKSMLTQAQKRFTSYYCKKSNAPKAVVEQGTCKTGGKYCISKTQTTKHKLQNSASAPAKPSTAPKLH